MARFRYSGSLFALQDSRGVGRGGIYKEVYKQEGFPITKAWENQVFPKRVSPALSFSAPDLEYGEAGTN